jgi:hypothetical protein
MTINEKIEDKERLVKEMLQRTSFIFQYLLQRILL